MKAIVIILFVISFLASFFMPLNAQTVTSEEVIEAVVETQTVTSEEVSVETIETPSLAEETNEYNSIRDAIVIKYAGMPAATFVAKYGGYEYYKFTDNIIGKLYAKHGMVYKKSAHNGADNLYVLRTPLKRQIVRTVKKVAEPVKTGSVDNFSNIKKEPLKAKNDVAKTLIQTINLEPLKVQVEYRDSSTCTECLALESLYKAAKIKQHHTNRSVVEIPLSHKTALAYNKYARCAGLKTINLGRRPERVSKRLWNSNSWISKQILRVKSHMACRKV